MKGIVALTREEILHFWQGMEDNWDEKRFAEIVKKYRLEACEGKNNMFKVIYYMIKQL